MQSSLSRYSHKCNLELFDGADSSGQSSSGQSFSGHLLGAPIARSGEMVFSTGMVGYTEALTDPSYYGQILVFSYPLIGNYGIPKIPEQIQIPIPRGFESTKIHAAATILAIDSYEAFHWNSFQTLDRWLKAQGVPGIVGVDTRHLVQLIRGVGDPKKQGILGGDHGVFGSVVPEGQPRPERFDPSATNILPAVSTKSRQVLGGGKGRIAVLDCGVKWNILRQLVDIGQARDYAIEIVPWDTDLASVKCDGWVFSNGPGNPQNTGDLVARIKNLFATRDVPILGICLGHQLLALAAGAQTQRLPFGHRSHNQPVQLVGTRRGFITSQNHGFEVVEESLPADWEVWFRNINDQSVEGLKHKTRPLRSVQFHPEAAGGPRDTGWILEEFFEFVDRKI